MARSPGAVHHARLLPNPSGLQQAMAAGLAPERVACLRPTASGMVEAALVHRWRIGWILARQSGAHPERHWHRIAEQEGCRLLLLQRPGEVKGVTGCSQAALLQRLATWTRV